MATSNFLTQRNFDLYAADFSLPVYAQDENGEEIEGEIVDYYFDEDFYDEAEKAVEALNSSLKFYKIELRDGYYSGVQTVINSDEAPDLAYYTGAECFQEYGVNRYILQRMMNAEKTRINRDLLPRLKEYGFEKFAVYARFNNGETWYTRCA
jgi:hypothetical protein